MPGVPDAIGRYLVRERIGEGGMGLLYLALDPAIDRLVAVKVLRADNEEMRKRFEREARTVGRFQHPNIVTIHDVGLHEGQPFIAMEYVAGDTLAETIDRQDPLPLGQRLELIEQLCAGLSYAHQRHVIHRDIKPANLMLDAESGHLKILDFGIARAATQDSGITVAGSRVGTPRYMSPEQAEGKSLDHRCDVFAVGLVFYELLSYQKAFAGGDRHLVAYRIVHEAPRPLRELNAGLDPELIGVVNRALEKPPDARYQDLSSMALDVARIRARLGRDQLQSTVAVKPRAAEGAEGTPRRRDRLDELRRRRDTQIRAHLREARSAIAARRLADARAAVERAALLSLDDPDVVAVMDEVDRAEQEVHIAEWLTLARARLTAGKLTEAADLVDRALGLRPDHPDAKSLRNHVRQVQAERERQRERALAVDRALQRGRRSLAAGALDSALRTASEALSFDADHAEAVAFKARVLEAIREREEAAARDHRAQQVADEAREMFEQGEHQKALELLRAHRPEHALTTETLSDLRREWEALEERRRHRQEAARQRELARGLESVKIANAAREFSTALAKLSELRRQGFESVEIEALTLAAEQGQSRQRRVRQLLDDTTQLLARQELVKARREIDTVLALEPDNDTAVLLAADLKRAEETLRLQPPDERASPVERIEPRPVETQSAPQPVAVPAPPARPPRRRTRPGTGGLATVIVSEASPWLVRLATDWRVWALTVFGLLVAVSLVVPDDATLEPPPEEVDATAARESEAGRLEELALPAPSLPETPARGEPQASARGAPRVSGGARARVPVAGPAESATPTASREVDDVLALLSSGQYDAFFTRLDGLDQSDDRVALARRQGITILEGQAGRARQLVGQGEHVRALAIIDGLDVEHEILTAVLEEIAASYASAAADVVDTAEQAAASGQVGDLNNAIASVERLPLIERYPATHQMLTTALADLRSQRAAALDGDIRGMLDRYAAAYSARDEAAVRALQTTGRIDFSGILALSLTLSDISIQIGDDGRSATVRCFARFGFEGQPGVRRAEQFMDRFWTLILREVDGQWLVESRILRERG